MDLGKSSFPKRGITADLVPPPEAVVPCGPNLAPDLGTLGFSGATGEPGSLWVGLEVGRGMGGGDEGCPPRSLSQDRRLYGSLWGPLGMGPFTDAPFP